MDSERHECYGCSAAGVKLTRIFFPRNSIILCRACLLYVGDSANSVKERTEAHKHWCLEGKHWWLVEFGGSNPRIHQHCPCGENDGDIYPCPEHDTR